MTYSSAITRQLYSGAAGLLHLTRFGGESRAGSWGTIGAPSRRIAPPEFAAAPAAQYGRWPVAPYGLPVPPARIRPTPRDRLRTQPHHHRPMPARGRLKMTVPLDRDAGLTRQQLIGQVRWHNAAVEFQAEFLMFVLALELATFNPAQPRVPAGTSDGGKWTSEGSGGVSGDAGRNRHPANLLVPVVDRRPGFPIPKNLAQFGLKSWIMQDEHPTRGWLHIIQGHSYPTALGASQWGH